MRYWLMKSEPNEFGIDDLQNLAGQTEPWDGVRNYQARNMMRDDMKVGDSVLFYHSNCKPPGIAGIMKVAKTAYPDFTAFDPNDKHYDPKSKEETPTWFMVDVKFEAKFPQLISLDQLREQSALEDMLILRKGNRLSITPVTELEWNTILSMAEEFA